MNYLTLIIGFLTKQDHSQISCVGLPDFRCSSAYVSNV